MLRKNQLIAVLIVSLLINAIVTHSQVLTLDPKVRSGQLSNGFTYHIRQNEEPKKRVMLYLANKVGSILEDDDQVGLAHFLEHMSFNGTKHYPKHALLDYLQKSGVRFGADINAYTGFDETVYQLPLPSDDISIINNGLRIMRDWAADATLEPEEIEKERGVVLEEKRMRSGAQYRLMEQYFPLQVNKSRYAHRLPIGTEAVLKSFTPATLSRFYKDWYRPNLQALIVVGDIDVDTIEQQIKSLFSDLKNPLKPRKRIQYTIPLTGKNQFFSATDPEQTATTLTLSIKQPALKVKTEMDERKAIIRRLFNGVLAERFYDLSQQTGMPFTNVSANAGHFLANLDAFSVHITAHPGQLKESFDIIWTEVERFKRFGVHEAELLRQKNNHLNALERAWQEKDKIPSSAYVEGYLQHFLNGTAAAGIEKEYPLIKQILASVSVAEVNAAIRSQVLATNRDIIILAPETEKDRLPTEKVINEIIRQVSDKELAKYAEKENEEELLSQLPTAGKIISTRQMSDIGVTKLQLSNGATVYLKSTDFKNEEILFSVFSEGGTSLYIDSVYLSADNADVIISSSGAGQLSPTSLTKFFSGKTVSVQPFIGERYEGMNGMTTPKDAEAALQLLHAFFTAPRKDTAVFNNILTRSKTSLENRANDPNAVFADSVNAVLGNYHYRRITPSVKQLDSIALDKVYDIFKERFANAGDFTFVFIGNIDTNALYPLIEKYIASLPAKSEHEQAKDIGVHIPGGIIKKDFYKGKEDIATVRLTISGDYTFNDANNIQLSALGSILQYRITERIREAEGGAYTPQAGVSYSKIPRSRYAFTIAFTCATANVDKLVVAAREEIEKLKTDGAPAGDIEKFKAERLRSLETQMRSNKYWQQYLLYALQNDEPLNGILTQEERLKEITPSSVKEAAAKYLDMTNYIQLVLLPEKQ